MLGSWICIVWTFLILVVFIRRYDANVSYMVCIDMEFSKCYVDSIIYGLCMGALNQQQIMYIFPSKIIDFTKGLK